MNAMKIMLAAILVSTLGIIGFSMITRVDESSANRQEQVGNPIQDTDTIVLTDEEKSSGEVVRNVSLSTDFEGAKVDRTDLLQGCFGGKDCIPSIDDPVFESAQEATWLSSEDRVFAIDHNGIKRAYPQRIMNWHEIVNDDIGGDPVAITFCPLCGSALAFIRQVDGIVTEFGVSGKLHNSDLVMYDRLEGNLWQQVTGEAIVGPAARREEVLEQVAITTTKWGDWVREYPDTQVLSRDTGHRRDYGRYPYGTYEHDDEIYFGVEGLDTTLQIKTPVYGIEIEGVSKAYPESALATSEVIEDQIAGVSVTVQMDESGEVSVINQQTGEKIIPIRLFWFAWAAFHPDTELYVK